MFRLIFLIFILSQSFEVHSQEVVDWSFHYDETKEIFIASVKIDEGWHLYSQKVDEYAGPVPTEFVFEESDGVKIIGDVKEPKPITSFDPNFDSEVAYFEHEVTFTQKIKLENNKQIRGFVTYMVCNDTMCLPPVDQEFTISINEQ